MVMPEIEGRESLCEAVVEFESAIEGVLDVGALHDGISGGGHQERCFAIISNKPISIETLPAR